MKRGNFTAEEEETIIKLHQSFGNKYVLSCYCLLVWLKVLILTIAFPHFGFRWSKIASKLPGRTDNEIKNVWHTHLKKRLSSKTNLNVDEAASKGSLNEEENSQESSPNASMSFAGSNISSKDDDAQISQKTFEHILTFSDFTEMLQEVDKPELLEMTFDIDPDIWSFIDGSDSSFQQPENRALQESEEDEVDKWFKHLECELGLEENDNQQQQQQHKQGTEDENSSSLLESYELLIH